MVASYLEEHANLYMPFVVSPTASDNLYNNDTETPDAMDALISSMSDPETSSVLAYERYIERVRSDTRGDHVVIAALASMFHVTINVVHARQRDCTVSITPPVDSQSNCELNLGLIMQYHFVGLDKQEIVTPHDNENPNTTNHYIEQTTPNDQSTSNLYIQSRFLSEFALMTSKVMPMTSPNLNQILMSVTSPLYLPQMLIPMIRPQLP